MIYVCISRYSLVQVIAKPSDSQLSDMHFHSTVKQLVLSVLISASYLWDCGLFLCNFGKIY